MKDTLLGLVSMLVALVLLVAVGELAVRGMHYYTAEFSGRMNPKHIGLDDDLGWLPTPDYAFDGELLDASGTAYPANIRINSQGYREYGDLQSGKKKVLFLGDSYTQAMQVSNDKTYYSLLADDLDVEVFAHGVNGYGTLQQYLLLEKIIDGIQPDAVVLQFCPNDVINNYYPLELASAYNNNGLRRPYLEEGDIHYRNPGKFPGLRDFAARYSEFLYFIISKLDRLIPPPENPAENIIEQQGKDYPLFLESMETMNRILGKIRGRVPGEVPIFAFSTNHGSPYGEVFSRVAEKNGIRYIEGPSQALREAEKNGLETRAADTEHWNDLGHRIVADVLGAEMRL